MLKCYDVIGGGMQKDIQSVKMHAGSRVCIGVCTPVRQETETSGKITTSFSVPHPLKIQELVSVLAHQVCHERL